MKYFLLLLLPLTCLAETPMEEFYSRDGREHSVTFEGRYRTQFTSLAEAKNAAPSVKAGYVVTTLEVNLRFLFGPLTRRAIGSPQKGARIIANWDGIYMEKGRVMLPFSYKGTWILNKKVTNNPSIVIPVPLNMNEIYSPNWKKCGDYSVEHQTPGYYWYFWDPKRKDCDQVLGEQYEEVTVSLGAATENEKISYPEYDRLLNSTGTPNKLQFTFAFGYVKESQNPDIEKDSDSGVYQYKNFVRDLEKKYKDYLTSAPIYQNEYKSSPNSNKIIGRIFTGRMDGVEIVIRAVVAAGIDPMEIFTKSFAHDHDAVFGWLGHSRVGSGFDALKFAALVRANPNYYSITPNYQILYWGGCNSYSYYTKPFFEHKARASNGLDPNGTKSLDIISNGMPSSFAFNSKNASILVDHVVHWREKASYQTIIDDIEGASGGSGVLVNVMGDEDNP